MKKNASGAQYSGLFATIEAATGKVAERSAARREKDGDKAIFEMARDKVLADYESTADQYKTVWMIIMKILEETPPSAMGYMDKWGSSRAVVRFELPIEKDGVYMTLRTIIHGFGDTSLSAAIRELHDVDKYDYSNDVISSHSFTETIGVKNVASTRIGMRKHKLAAADMREAQFSEKVRVWQMVIQNISKLYIECNVTAFESTQNSSQTIAEAAVGLDDFEPERYERYLPSWEQRLGGKTWEHPLFALKIPKKTTYYEHMEKQLRYCIPDRSKSYEAVSQLIDLIEQSEPIDSSHFTFDSKEDTKRLDELMNFYASVPRRLRV